MPGEKSRPPDSGFRLAVAVGVLAAFAAFVAFMLTEVGAAEVRWARLAWIFASVEAIAFGAAGALFGSSVQRSRAEKAEESAKENAQDAANGRALAELLKAEASPDEAGAGESPLESLGAGDARPGPADVVAARHAELARRLFP